MLTDIRSVLRTSRRRKDKTASARFFAAPGIISLAGQQNPTCGTTAFLDATGRTGNLHKISALRRAGASGTMAANAFAWLNPHHALTVSNFHYRRYDN
jgi:hypothetical protein